MTHLLSPEDQEALRGGATLAQVAKRLGKSRQAVGRAAKLLGIDGQGAREDRRRKLADAAVEAAREYLTDTPYPTTSRLRAAFPDLPADLPADIVRLTLADSGGTASENERVISDIRLAASRLDEGTSLTAPEYDRLRPDDAVSSSRVTQLFDGSWLRALEAAGVEAATTRPPRDRTWDRTTCQEAVRAYLEQEQSRPSYARACVWLKTQDGRPSGQTVRNRMYPLTWAEIVRDAVSSRPAVEEPAAS